MAGQPVRATIEGWSSMNWRHQAAGYVRAPGRVIPPPAGEISRPSPLDAVSQRRRRLPLLAAVPAQRALSGGWKG